MLSALDVSKWFINELHPEPLKLQKLLYLAQGFSFAFHDKELFFGTLTSCCKCLS